jgi:hypothetical protein
MHLPVLGRMIHTNVQHRRRREIGDVAARMYDTLVAMDALVMRAYARLVSTRRNRPGSQQRDRRGDCQKILAH